MDEKSIWDLLMILVGVIADGDMIGMKHAFEQIMRSPESIWGFVVYMNLYVYAKVKSKDLKDVRFRRIKKKERSIVDYELGEAIAEIEANLWHGITAFEQKMHDAGVYKMPINSNNHLVNAPVSDIKRDYHTAYGKERPEITRKLLTEIYNEIETKEAENGLIRAEKDIESINESSAVIANRLRGSYFDKVHKRSGCLTEIKIMEEECLPKELLTGICKNVLTTAVERRIIRRNDEAKVNKELNINLVSIVKITKTLLNKLGRSK